MSLAVALAGGQTVVGGTGKTPIPHSTPPAERALTVALQRDEADLVRAFENLRAGRIDDALVLVAELVARNPDFRLAQLVYGDLLSAKHRVLTGLGDAGGAGGERLTALREEAWVRLRHGTRLPSPGHVPANLLKLSESQAHALVVDLAASRLYLFARRDGQLHLVRDRYVSTGRNGAAKRRQGDQRTPVGVYFTIGRIPVAELADFYGTGALPVSYPNGWDQLHGRSGYGIWIHGVPDGTYVRAPRASDGCMVLSNADMSHLWELVGKTETPVVIVDGLRWESTERVARRTDEVEAAIRAWVRDWESVDHQAYANHYAPELRVDALVRSFGQVSGPACDPSSPSHASGEDDVRQGWLSDQQRVDSRQRCVQLDDLSIFAYPGEPETVVVTFEHNLHSSAVRSRVRTRQYWKRDGDGRWRIVLDDVVRLRPEHLQGIPYSARTAITRPDRER
jgi:ketosteroid isomerase-like protein